jgi:hypothetical protein
MACKNYHQGEPSIYRIYKFFLIFPGADGIPLAQPPMLLGQPFTYTWSLIERSWELKKRTKTIRIRFETTQLDFGRSLFIKTINFSCWLVTKKIFF